MPDYKEMYLHLMRKTEKAIGILVKAIQVAVFTQPAQYLTAVSAATKGHVDISARRTDGQAVDSRLQHHGNVLHESEF